ncbi:hypothetical protein HanIR_Chr17g0894621 [Helianthus annuus]|nr:hypothetical protein HanIR_Chr17g0894621 [Helianthus annuus]
MKQTEDPLSSSYGVFSWVSCIRQCCYVLNLAQSLLCHNTMATTKVERSLQNLLQSVTHLHTKAQRQTPFRLNARSFFQERVLLLVLLEVLLELISRLVMVDMLLAIRTIVAKVT